jgi:hypothetical protein
MADRQPLFAVLGPHQRGFLDGFYNTAAMP